MSEKQPIENADDPVPRPEKENGPSTDENVKNAKPKPEPRPEERPEPVPAPEPDPVITEEKTEETPKHKVTLTKPHKCPRCGENTEPGKIKTREGVTNARICRPCGKAYT